MFPVNESEVAAACDAALEAAGWFVVKTLQRIATQRQLAGLPDRLCFRRNQTLLVEYKGEGGVVRDSQKVFGDRMHDFQGPNLAYLVVYHPSQLPRWAR